MKRTTKFTAAALLATALLFTGCHSASAQCAGGACSRTAGFWSPWGGIWYYSAPCAGGKCGVKKPAAEPEEPKVEEEADHFREPAEMVAEPAAPEPADQKPELIEDPAAPADPEPAIVAVPLVCPAAAAIVNARRASFGLPPLEIDLGMIQECENHSN